MRTVLILFIAIMAASAAEITLPEGPGKDITETMCTACHGLENIVRARMTKERWGKVVDDMVSRGAEGSDDEVDQVIAYLAANFGKGAPKPININKAPASDLMETLQISAVDAAAIVNYRSDKGNFKKLQDVTKVPGIDTKKIEAAKDLIEF